MTDIETLQFFYIMVFSGFLLGLIFSLLFNWARF